MDNNTRNSNYTKQYNRKLILSIIQRESVSRASLARKTGLTRASVSIIVDKMISTGIVLVKGTATSELGRKPVILDINPNFCFALGLNIARDGCVLGIVNLKGDLIKSIKINLDDAKNSTEAINIISDKINDLIENSGVNQEQLLGLGISTPGPINIYDGIIINPPNFHIWNNVKIVEDLKKNFTFNITLDNNSAALALAEKYFGLGRKFSNFILMVVDSGIGSGVIIENSLYRGYKGFGAEIGHTSINSNGDKCSCGNYGCLELYASIPAIIDRANKNDINYQTWNEIVDGAMDEDASCIKIINEEACYLTTGIVNAVNIIEIEAVVLTGYIKYKPDLLLNKIHENVNKRIFNRDIYSIDILATGIKENAGVIASATLVFDSFIYT